MTNVDNVFYKCTCIFACLFQSEDDIQKKFNLNLDVEDLGYEVSRKFNSQDCSVKPKIFSFCKLSGILVQWNLWQDTTAMRDWPLMKDHCCTNVTQHFYTFMPPMKYHLSYKTTFCSPHHKFHCSCLVIHRHKEGLTTCPSQTNTNTNTNLYLYLYL